MTAWEDVERREADFARRVRALLDAHRLKTIATLRADGSPRISGIKAEGGRWLPGGRPKDQTESPSTPTSGRSSTPISTTRDDAASRRLVRAIQGRGAFRQFRNELNEEYPELVSVWHTFCP